MDSCSRAPALMLSCYRSPTLSYRRGSGHAWVLLLDFANLLVCSDSLPAPSSIPRESIRSLGNWLPVLARTGFQNRAPVEAKRSFLKRKVLLSRGRLQEPSERPQELSKRLQESRKDVSRTTTSYFHTLILSYYHSLILSYDHILALSYSHTLILAYSCLLILSFSRTHMLSYPHTLVLSCSPGLATSCV